MWYLCVVAPSAPTDVSVTSNATGAIVVQWVSPQVVVHRVDRYYIQYQATSEPDSHQLVVEEVNNSFDFYQVN